MMAMPVTGGNPDQDLVAMMMPHHHGVIGMARVPLRDGGAPLIPRMAQRVVADQEHEVREFRAWQAEHSAPE